MDTMLPDAITAETTVRPHPDIAMVELDGEAVLYDERTGALHHLDQTATLVWSCLDGSESLHDLAGALAQASGADHATVEADVVALARDLGRRGLFEGVEGRHDLAAEDGGARPYADAPEEEC